MGFIANKTHMAIVSHKPLQKRMLVMSLNQWVLFGELEDISNCLNGYFERVLMPPVTPVQRSAMLDWIPGFDIGEANLSDLVKNKQGAK